DRIDVVYRDTKGDVFHRDAKGYGGLHYKDSSGRNDIVASKVAVGKNEVFFYVETADALTPCTDPDWMLLLIDSDGDSSTGWYGYDILINKDIASDGKGNVLKYADGKWIKAGEYNFAVSGNKLELAVPKALLGVSGKSMTFDFKWADNTGELVDPISLCLKGDTAPNRRFNYRFIWNK
ncbi:MAG: hypothetical protein KIG75_04730, partial [Bacteroidales bacterium]|nr:hypothetical protein [Bacteroidales bacterium]